MTTTDPVTFPFEATRSVGLIVARQMTELGSARQVLLWFRREKVCLPAKVEGPAHHVVWKLSRVQHDLPHVAECHVCRGLCIWKDRVTHQDYRWPHTQDDWTPEAAGILDGFIAKFGNRTDKVKSPCRSQ